MDGSYRVDSVSHSSADGSLQAQSTVQSRNNRSWDNSSDLQRRDGSNGLSVNRRGDDGRWNNGSELQSRGDVWKLGD